jgi:hypothetical protein
MKTRKILPLILLAVGSLFLLSSCDAMLDAIFQNNQIYVDVEISGANYPLDWTAAYRFGAYPGSVTLSLYDVTTGSTTTSTGSWTSADINYVHFPFTFTKLKGDTFTLTATFTSAHYFPTYQTLFYDPSGLPMSSISMPYKNSGDSTGHSVSLYMIF